MIKILFLFSLVFLYTVNEGFAQSDYRSGFVITNTNDTIHGLINYREGSKKYKSCEFKKSIDQKVVEYLPQEIKGYKLLGDKYFESKYIAVVSELLEDVFLEVLIKGNVSLYKYQKSFFVDKQDSLLYKLITEEKKVDVDGKEMLMESKKYIGVLSYLLSDCQDVSYILQRVELLKNTINVLIPTI